MRNDLQNDVVSLTDFARNTKQQAEEQAHEAEEYRMDLRLREAVENYAKGDRGDPAKVVMNRLRERARKRRSEG
jgi:hypothetical protein